MKTILKAFKATLIIGCLSISLTTFASEDPKVEKKKTYAKTYTLTASDKVSLNNQFGEVKIVTWDRNEVKVDVSITAKANSDERAQEILNTISIEDGKNGSGVFFKTNMSNQKKGNNSSEKYKNEGFSIDYSVSMPSRNALKVQNSFGSTIIPNYSGEAEIVSKFGSLKTGNLANAKMVSVEFGSAMVESMHDGKLSVKFSRAIVNKLTGNIDAIFEHSSGIKLGIDNSIKGLNVKNNFSTLYLDVARNLSADFDIKTHFGEVSNKSEFAIKKEEEDEDRHGPQFNHRYLGKSGSGNVTMKISSEFGQIIVGHNLTMNLEEDQKDKKKVRTI